MEYVRALAVHFAALLLSFMGVMGLISAVFGRVSLESEMTILTVEPVARSRRLNALLGSLCLLAGGGVFLLAVREFRPPSYALLIAGSLTPVALVVLLLKATLRGVEAMESAVAKGTLFMVNGIILGLLSMAVFYVGRHLWRAFVAV